MKVTTTLILALTAWAWTVQPGRAAEADGAIRPINERFASEGTKEVPGFRRHVVPLLGKLGCNGRACHGSFQGQGGFRLSLFGYDFKLDHDNLTQGSEEKDPRADVEFPETSLMLEKPTLTVPHKGGQRLEVGSWEYRVLLEWIKGGARPVADDHPPFQGLEVTPQEIVFGEKGERVKLRVMARWADGAREDVTPLCRFQTNNGQVAEIDEEGRVTANEPGDTHVVVFYDNGVVPVPVMRPVSEFVGAKYPDVPTPTKIDELVVAKLRKLGIVPSDLADDAEFLRRVSLDMTGTLPGPEEIEKFLADDDPDKRRKKIDELLESPAYAAWWTTKLCDVTGNNDDGLVNVTPVRGQASREWYEWIHKRVAGNVPYDKLVEGIVTAVSREPGESFEDYCRAMSELYRPDSKGSFADRSSMPYYWARRTFRQPAERAIGFAYAFMGIRIQCAQCHKHPFDQWTQDDFQKFTGFFTRTNSGINPQSRREYQAMLEELDLEGRRGNQLRRELPRLLRDGKVVPFQEVYNGPARGGRRNNGAIRNLRRQISSLQDRVERLKKDGEAAQARPLERQLAQAQERLRRVQRNQRGGGAGTAKLLGGEVIDLSKHEDPRKPLMEWLRAEENPYFARAFVNRVWAGYFNVGIVDPPDDLSLANPPSNKPLLDYLAQGFIESGYDMKWLHREIAGSRTYQLSWRPNETNRLDEKNFSRQVPRRLPAEVAVDVLAQATASDEAHAAMRSELDERAITIPGAGRRNRATRGKEYALTIFGRSTRESNCDCDRSSEASLLQTVYLQNDQDVLAMIDRRDGWLAELARELGVRFTPQATPQPSARGGRRAANARQIVARLEQQIRRLKRAGNNEQAQRLQRRLAQFRRQAGRRGAAAAESGPSQPAKGEKVVETMDPDAIVKRAYLRTLSRYPKDEELARAREYIAQADDTLNGVRGLMWALINTKEFIVNH